MISRIAAAVAAALVTATPASASELVDVEVEAFNDTTLVEGPLVATPER
ncbi:hypothetical protein C8D88_103335 [Lentzea atacamensis]|uniref:Uncharacterized protein n=1 Tax=Lentzea atacamensis TaxID=531938 RepID=A0A316ILR9_9PSEU|nr:hypothetical protein [Lentzea atacamensis]PWK88139.1 hypothetical protein C8D88_103335 [Lentzea atacamensis]RAS71141.1 hypothetical protein C8D87_1011442 [Lentzea atacamensis]